MSKLDKMCYTQFVCYLREKEIPFKEEDWTDEDQGEFCVAVKPDHPRLKERSFSYDGGWQIN